MKSETIDSKNSNTKFYIDNREKMVEFTVEKPRGELERRVYIFDTVHDHKVNECIEVFRNE